MQLEIGVDFFESLANLLSCATKPEFGTKNYISFVLP
jgi:hypothetical protein